MAKPATEITFGLRASLAVLAARAKDLVRIGWSDEAEGQIAELLAQAKRDRLPCARMSPRDLADVAGSSHHEGLVVEAKARAFASVDALPGLLAGGRGVAVALDRVRNPYNVGAIVRTAAFLGVDAVLFGAPAPHPGLSAEAVRVAEGGAEHLSLARTTDLAESLARLKKAGVRVVGADGDATASAFDGLGPRPLVVVVGNEREGMLPRVEAACDLVAKLPGTGRVESLNVAVASALMLREALR